MTARGKFITLEGGEGAGKSTQVRALAEALENRGIDVLVTREPGGSPGAEKIRELLLDPALDWSVNSEALLFAAARADHIDRVIEPALASGRWVISDRFLDSSLAYQGSAGGLGLERVRDLHRFTGSGLVPDRTVILDSGDCDARLEQRDGALRDRIGGQPPEYHDAVSRAFCEIANAEPDRVRLVDGSGERADVTKLVLAAIADLLP